MGKMSYEESLQRFGAPTNCADAGSTKVCTWVYGSGGMVMYPIGNTYIAQPTYAPTARLTFKNDILIYWQLTGRWQ